MTDPRIMNLQETLKLHADVKAGRYCVHFYCANCYTHYDFSLPKGVRKKGIKADCPNCGCEGELV